MIHNNTPNRTRVKLVWDLDFIAASKPLAKKVKPVLPMWMDVRRGWGYPVFDVVRGRGGSNRTYTFPDDATPDPYATGTVQNEYTMPFDGTVVSAVGHLHPGGQRDDIDVIRNGASLPAGTACRRVATGAIGARPRVPSRPHGRDRRPHHAPLRARDGRLGQELRPRLPLAGQVLRPGRAGVVGRVADRFAARLARAPAQGRHRSHQRDVRGPAVVLVREHGHRPAVRRAERPQRPGPVRQAGGLARRP